VNAARQLIIGYSVPESWR